MRFAPSAAAAAAAFDGEGGATLLATPTGIAEGTAVATPDGWVPVERLAPGDVVLPGRVIAAERRVLSAATLARDPEARPVLVHEGAFAPGVPARDLLVGPGTRLKLGGGWAPAAMLVDGTTVCRVAPDRGVAFIRLRLQGAVSVLAEGLDCDSAARGAPDMAAVAAARRLLAARGTSAPGALGGNVARADHASAFGWAMDAAAPTVPVFLELVVDGVPAGHALADLRRPDLEMAGLGDGRCGFAVTLPRRLSAGRDHVLLIRRAEDGADVPGSPMLLPHAVGTPAQFNTALATELAAGGEDLASFLAGQAERLLQERAARR